MKKINVAIVGAGKIGQKRAASLPEVAQLKIVCDINKDQGEKLASDCLCQYESKWENVVKNPEIEAIIVATTHDWLTPIGREAILNHKHVLLEKPGARTLAELDTLYEVFKKNPVVLDFGYNHRHHPSIQMAKELTDSKQYGEIMFIRAKYGHGARLGYEKEWRFIEKISGGGELIDQGSHLIDLVNYFGCKMDDVIGYTATMFWKTALEDAAFFVMRNKIGQIAHLSVTCVEWKNIFSFEIMLERAKIQIDGLGGSYGPERLSLFKMKPEMGPPDVQEFLFEEKDNSWKIGNTIFFGKIKKKDYTNEAIRQAGYVLKMIKKLYDENK